MHATTRGTRPSTIGSSRLFPCISEQARATVTVRFFAHKGVQGTVTGVVDVWMLTEYQHLPRPRDVGCQSRLRAAGGACRRACGTPPSARYRQWLSLARQRDVEISRTGRRRLHEGLDADRSQSRLPNAPGINHRAGRTAARTRQHRRVTEPASRRAHIPANRCRQSQPGCEQSTMVRRVSRLTPRRASWVSSTTTDSNVTRASGHQQDSLTIGSRSRARDASQPASSSLWLPKGTNPTRRECDRVFQSPSGQPFRPADTT